MTCTKVQEQLWELAIEDFDSLEPHLGQCRECAALAAAIREEQQSVEAGLAEFASAVPLREALVRARELKQPASSPAPARWKMLDSGLHWVAIAAAAAAALSVGLYTTVPGNPAAMVPQMPVEVPITVTSACVDLRKLEPGAIAGTLSEEAVECLVLRADDPDDPDLVKAVRLLTVNAFAMGDDEQWERFSTHLAAIEPEDASVAFKLAIHYSRNPGPDGQLNAHLSAERALKVAGVWSGETYVKRAGILHRLNVKATRSIWEERPREAREMARKAALDWLEFSVSESLPLEAPEAACLAVTGDPRCEE